MRFPNHKLIAGFVCLVALTGCGVKPKTFNEARSMRPPGEQSMRVQEFANTASAADMALLARNRAVFAWASAVHDEEQPAPPREPRSVTPPTAALAPSSIGEGVPCGGDLPPCFVVDRESHGTWDAYNPTGCSGTGCFGPYQFGGFWAGKLGLPLDLWSTTHEQWVNAARQLWANGAGASNWGL